MKLALAMLLAFPATLPAAELRDADQIARCVRDNRPKANTIETIELTTTDRLGNERVRRATVYSGRSLDAVRTLYVRFIYPSDLSGSSLLLAELDGKTQMFVSVSGQTRLTRVAAAGRNPRLFGSDFSSEDLARLYGMTRPGSSQRLGDGQSDGRPTYVIETHPPDDADSSYAVVVSHVDKDTCVVLRSELYERPEELRKVLTVPAGAVKQVGSTWHAHDLLMRDLRDQTQTRLVVERVETGDRVRDLPIHVGPQPEVGAGPSPPD